MQGQVVRTNRNRLQGAGAPDQMVAPAHPRD
jgi:hypothetical protein